MNVKPGNFDKVLQYVKDYSSRFSLPVDLMAIAKATGVPKSSAARYLEKMVEDGIVDHSGVGYITVRQKERTAGWRYVPKCGRVSCGIPQDTALEEYNYEYYAIPASWLSGGEYFLLEAEGDSMINAGIYEGDMILIRAQDREDYDGQIVVAMVGGETLLKRIHVDQEKGYTELIPENDEYEILRCCHENEAEQVIVQGVAVMKLSMKALR
ncbi:MAG: helix-turn-helix domain-containing protein [Oscillospiraceae bacterium]|nr:helix-turn-helix domain-containing protein [Oscillospiraceae bacterium]